MPLPPRVDGERIFLSALDTDVLSAAYQQWMRDRDVLRFLADPEGDYDLECLRQFVRAMNESPNNYLFGIFLRMDGRHIGNIKIGGVHPKHKYADVGIIIGDKTIWGKGFATEAIRSCVRFAFEELRLHKLFAGMIEGNEGSYKAFLKAGFRDAGCYRDHVLVDGEYRDSRIVEIINA